MKKWRKSAGLSQEKLAQRCDAAHTYIRQIESGVRCQSFAFIEKIAAALNIAPFQLFYDESSFSAGTAENPHLARLKEAEISLLNGMAAHIRGVFGALY